LLPGRLWHEVVRQVSQESGAGQSGEQEMIDLLFNGHVAAFCAFCAPFCAGLTFVFRTASA